MCSKISASFKGNFLKGTVFVILEVVLLDSFIPIFGTRNRLIKKVNSDWKKKKISQILITLGILLNHYKWCVVYVWCYYFIVTVCCYWSSLDCFGDDDGWNFFWTTVKMEYLYIFRYCWWHCKHFLFITEILCIMWPVMFFISYFENPKDFNLRKVVFPTDWIFLFAHSFANGDFFSFCSTLCLLCWSPWIDFYTKHQLEEHQ